MRGEAAAVRADLASRLAKCREVLSSVASSTKAIASAPAIYADAVQLRARPAQPKRQRRVASKPTAANEKGFQRYMQRPRESAARAAAADDFDGLRARAAAARARIASVQTRIATTKDAIAARAAGGGVQRQRPPAGAAQRAAPSRRRAHDDRINVRSPRRASGGGKRAASDGGACTQYNRYGRCDRGRSCKYVHDVAQVAVCRAFITGSCSDVRCLLTHELQPEKMPVCRHFLRGACALPQAECLYLHVKLGSTGMRQQQRKKRRVRGGADGRGGTRTHTKGAAKNRGAGDAPPLPPAATSLSILPSFIRVSKVVKPSAAV